jgi:hypothetical protein
MSLKKLFSRKKKKEEEDDADNPFSKPTAKHKEIDEASFSYYVKEKYGSFDRNMEKRFGALSAKKIHVRFLRQTKRILGAFYFFLFLMLGFVSLSAGPFSLFFFGAAFLMLDYLWKSRRVSWEKKKE